MCVCTCVCVSVDKQKYLTTLNVHRSRSPSAQVTGQTSSAPSSCHTPAVRRSSRAPATASSTTPTRRRAPSRTDSVSSRATTEQLTRCEAGDRDLADVCVSAPLKIKTPPQLNPFVFCLIRLWLYQTTPTPSCPVGKMERCDGSTSAPRPAAQRKTARMYVISSHFF